MLTHFVLALHQNKTACDSSRQVPIFIRDITSAWIQTGMTDQSSSRLNTSPQQLREVVTAMKNTLHMATGFSGINTSRKRKTKSPQLKSLLWETKEHNTKVETNLNNSKGDCPYPGPLGDLQKSLKLPQTLTGTLGPLFGLRLFRFYNSRAAEDYQTSFDTTQQLNACYRSRCLPMLCMHKTSLFPYLTIKLWPINI